MIPNLVSSVYVQEMVIKRPTYDKDSYSGNKLIKIYFINKENEIENIEDHCCCNKCPFVKKHNKNPVMMLSVKFSKCYCCKGLKKYFNYLSNKNSWKGFTIIEIICDMCKVNYKNQEFNDL